MTRRFVPPICTRPRAQGTASVEAVLLLPFLCVLTVLALYTTQLMLLKQENQIEARRTAWRHATLAAVCFSPPRTLEYGDLLRRSCSTDKRSATQFLATLQRGGQEKHKQELVRMLRTAGIPGAVRATSYASQTFGRPERPAESWTRLVLVDHHTVDAMRHWERRDLPLGYDTYLKKVLNSDILFPDYFPKAR